MSYKGVINAIENYYEINERQSSLFMKVMEKLKSKSDMEKLLKVLKRKKEVAWDRVTPRVNDLKGLLTKGGSLLDIGAGDASITAALKKDLSLKEAYAIDLKEHKVEGVKYLSYKKDGSIPLESESMDNIILLMSFHHIPKEQREKMVSEIYRILKKGGRLILREHDCDDDKLAHVLDLIHYVHNVANNEEEYPASYLNIEQVAKTFNMFEMEGDIKQIKKDIKTLQRIYYISFIK